MSRKDIDDMEAKRPDQALADKCLSHVSRLEAILKTRGSTIEKITKQLHACRNYQGCLQSLLDLLVEKNGYR